MNDAEWIFNQTNQERKRNGRGDYCKKRRGGKVVRFPSDGLSRKEREKLNGEVKQYSFAKPLFWDEFRELPDDVKQMYLDLLKEKFDCLPGVLIAESMGIAYNSFSSYLAKHGLDLRANGRKTRSKDFLKTEDGKAWVKWHEVYRRETASEEEVSGPVEDVVEEPAEPIEVKANVVGNDASRIAELIAALSGSGAKLTIEIVL